MKQPRNSFSNLLAEVYDLVRKHRSADQRVSHEGHEFENEVVRTISRYERELDLKIFDPRKTLPFQTYSSILPQLDGVFKIGAVYYFIECKHRKSVTAEQIGYFNSKLLDYSLGAHVRGKKQIVKGMFLATSPIGDNHLMYALSYGIIVIDPETPPLFHMLKTAKNNDLKKALNRLYEKLEHPFDYIEPAIINPERLVREYRYLAKKWLQDRG